MTIAPTSRRVEALVCLMAAALLALLMLPTVAVANTARVAPPACWPAQVGGTGSKAVRVTSDYGQAIVWWCGQEQAGIVASWAYTMMIPDSLPSSLTGALAALWEANVVEAVPEEDRIPRRQLEQDAYIALQSLRPTAPRWLVAPNGVILTRPAYAYTERTAADGTKQIVLDPAPVRATVGKVCDCAALKYAPGSVTYCLIPPASLTAATTVPKPVAVCRLQ